MLFNSTVFLWLFLPAVLIVHTPLIRLSVPLANLFLLAASLVFYAWGSGELVLLLAVSVIVDYMAADLAATARTAGRPRLVRAAVVASIVVNIALLGYFKYAGFLSQSIDAISRSFGSSGSGIIEVVLPIGISFFTFQSMSYTFDVAEGRVEPVGNPLTLFLYVSLFPQLIAGPIVRARDIRYELEARVVDLEGLSDGFSRFAWGLAKKVLIADQVAPLVDAAIAGEPTTASAWIAAVGFAVQIFFDFSGYSDMAIGLGRMLGFTFPENFLRPYAAASVTDFWRRWHITLSTWFRDYLYIPLGGNRHGLAATLRNLMIVFLVTGLWHGAAWTFVLWGVWHGSALLVERLAGFGRSPADSIAASVGTRMWTGAVVLGGWVLFASPDLATAGGLLRAMVVPTPGLDSQVASAVTPLTASVLVLGIVASAVPLRFRPVDWLRQSGPRAEAFRFAVYLGALPLVAVQILNDVYTPFLYYRF